MPTLIRLLTVTGATAALAYGAMYAVISAAQPQQRDIIEAANVPGYSTLYGGELRTGRSVAAMPGR